MEFSRTSLASRTSWRTHFEVLGLKASSPRKLPCPRFKNSTIFWTVKILLESARNLAENLQRPFQFSFFRDRLKKNFKDLFFWENLLLSLLSLASAWSIFVLGLKKVCPRKGCPSLAFFSYFFCVLGLGLEPCVLDFTSDYYRPV